MCPGSPMQLINDRTLCRHPACRVRNHKDWVGALSLHRRPFDSQEINTASRIDLAFPEFRPPMLSIPASPHFIDQYSWVEPQERRHLDAMFAKEDDVAC